MFHQLAANLWRVLKEALTTPLRRSVRRCARFFPPRIGSEAWRPPRNYCLDNRALKHQNGRGIWYTYLLGLLAFASPY